MSKFALFNPAIDPAPVLGWYDTDALTYDNLPAASDLLELTDAEWDARLADPNGWAVSGGKLVAYSHPAPVPTLAQQAQDAIQAGLTITLSGSLTLAATRFPTDASTQSKLNAIATVLATTGAFPDGSTSYPMKDSADSWHVFTVAQYKAVAGAIASYVAALYLIADGNPLSATALPTASVSLTV